MRSGVVLHLFEAVFVVVAGHKSDSYHLRRDVFPTWFLPVEDVGFW